MPLSEILDTQGRAVEKMFLQQGKKVEQVRVGRYVELDLPTTDKDKALSLAKELSEFVLCNPLIEKFEVQVL